jgi:hypothetical protein
MPLGQWKVEPRFLPQIRLAFLRGIGEDEGMNALSSSGMKSVSRREILRALGASAGFAAFPRMPC